MRLDIVRNDLVLVTLSRRNLLTLLANLEGHPFDTDCTLYRRHAWEAPVLAVRVEPDELHYAERAPGRMPDAVEAWIHEHT